MTSIFAPETSTHAPSSEVTTIRRSTSGCAFAKAASEAVSR